MSDEDLTTTVRTLTAAGAKRVLEAAERAAAAKRLAVSIAVVDQVGNLIGFLRLGHACVTSIEASIRKARTAANLAAPTKLFEDLLHGGMTSLLAFDFISPSQGGIPLTAAGSVVGGIGCSGSPGDEDEAIALAGAAGLADAAAGAQPC